MPCRMCGSGGAVSDIRVKFQGGGPRDIARMGAAFRKIVEGTMKPKQTVHVTVKDSTIGVLSTGDSATIRAISVSATAVFQAGHADVAKALEALAAAFASSTQLAAQQRTEALEMLEELGRQAALPAASRAKPGIVKALVSSVAATAGIAGGAAEVWSTWGTPIRQFFGT